MVPTRARNTLEIRARPFVRAVAPSAATAATANDAGAGADAGYNGRGRDKVSDGAVG